MQYIIEHDGISFEIPRYSFKIDDEIADINEYKTKSNSDYKRLCKKQYDFIKGLIGDRVVDVIGEFDTCDPNDITIIFDEIVEAYSAPVREYQEEKLKESINIDQYSKLFDFIEKTNKLGLNNSANRQVFSVVK